MGISSSQPGGPKGSEGDRPTTPEDVTCGNIQQLHILTNANFIPAGLHPVNHSRRNFQGISDRRAGNLLMNFHKQRPNAATHPLVSEVVGVDVFQGNAHQVRWDVGEDPWQLFTCLQVRTGLRKLHVTQVLM